MAGYYIVIVLISKINIKPMNKIIIKKSDFKELYDTACTTWIKKLDDYLKPYQFSEFIEFSESFVKEMKGACDTKQRVIFDKIFKEFKSDSLFDRIKTYSDVCKELGEKEITCPYQKIKQIEKLFNGDWKKDWTNRSQYKYYPYFEYSTSSGFGFYSSLSPSYSFSGGVAFYKDQETSDYVGKTFIDIYKELSK